MKQFLQFVALIVISIFVYTAPVYADTVLLHNGDRLIGTVQDSYFALQSPYGQIVIKNDFLKRISLPDGQSREAKLQTVNNDLFNGAILNEDIHIQLQTETTEKRSLFWVMKMVVRIGRLGPLVSSMMSFTSAIASVSVVSVCSWMRISSLRMAPLNKSLLTVCSLASRLWTSGREILFKKSFLMTIWP